MAKGVDKKIEAIAKNPDQVLKTLTTGFQWSRQHSQLVIGLIVLFFVVGSGLAIREQITTKAEIELQEKYYNIERSILEKKKAYETALQASKAPPAGLNEKDKKKTPAATTPPPAPLDYAKDFSNLVDQLKEIAVKNPQHKAGLMAALQASEVLVQYKKETEALDLLSQLPITKSNELLTALVLKQKGNIEANLGQCQKAITTWDQVLNSKTFEFLHTDVKLRQALCFETLKDDLKAEKIYQELTQKTGTGPEDQQESFSAQEAQKYLRLLRMKKGS